MDEETLKFAWKKMAADQTYHYTGQDIERYLAGGMSAQEMHDMERAALIDPMLADAIDGYRLANPAITAQHLNEISALINKQEKENASVVTMPSKNKNWQRWAVAAASIGVLGFSAWLMMRESQHNEITGIAATANPVIIDSISKNTETADNLARTSADTVAKVSAESLRKPQTAKAVPDAARYSAPISQKTEQAGAVTSTASDVSAVRDEVVQPAARANTPIAAMKTEEFQNNQPEAFRKDSAPLQSNARPMARYRGFGARSFNGRVTDENGKPLAGASIFSGNISTVTNLHGDFHLSLPVAKDTTTINISALGYENSIAMLTAGKNTGIVLQPSQAKMDEVVVVGYGTQKKKAMVGSIKNLKADTLSTTAYPYPDGGWESFYDDLIAELGVNKSRADKLLHLKFIVENGIPSDFVIVQTPDMAIADRAIAAIKKGPRWKNFKNRAYAEVKLKVE